jgi:hypothetical protein
MFTRSARQSALAASSSHVIAATDGNDIFIEVNGLFGDIGDFKVPGLDEDGEDGSRRASVTSA